MVSELFLYDRDNGLFKEVVKKSLVLKGRYHVAPHYGHELNTSNLEQYFKDPLSGMTDAGEKYPCMVCIAPKSRKIVENDTVQEQFYFNTFFLSLTGRTGQNQFKLPDFDTNSSAHHIWYDWQDMSMVADSFLEALVKISRMRTMQDGTHLRQFMLVDREGAVTTRLSRFNNDNISGVSLSFTISLFGGSCELNGFEADALNSIKIPSTFNIAS